MDGSVSVATSGESTSRNSSSGEVASSLAVFSDLGVAEEDGALGAACGAEAGAAGAAGAAEAAGVAAGAADAEAGVVSFPKATLFAPPRF